MKTNLLNVMLGIFLLLGCQNVVSQHLVVKPDSSIAVIQPTMWGLFYEDINFAGDGGLYAELIKNRSFEFYKPLMGWEIEGASFETATVLVQNRMEGESQNPRYIEVKIKSPKASVALKNNGFRGMGLKSGLDYNFSVLARQSDGETISLRLELLNSKGDVIGSGSVTPSGKDWKTYHSTLKSSQTDAKGSFRIVFEGAGIVDLDMISLFPSDTWKNRPGGLRADLVQLLYDMKPGFLRFPGGCIVEGRDLNVRYQWKKTVGPVEERKMIVNRWNTEFAHRLTPDYFQSFGLGFYEYFLLSRDLGAEPLPILNCGMACQFNTAEVVAMDELDPYIQDALDLIEFANGPVDSKWGKLRAEMGSPEPFNMKYIGIGNEQWGPQYIERYTEFVKAIKAKYPEIVIVSGAGPFPEGVEFDFGMRELKKLNAELIDEHYYKPAQWFLDNATRYDSYDRNGPKIFAGEYAAQSVGIASPDNKNTWEMAIAEAAFMTGLERNADVVNMCSYAPLFAHVEGWQWTPDMIWFDNLKSVGSANYQVQKIFSTNKGTSVVPVLLNKTDKVIGQNGLYATGAIDEETDEVIVKIVNVTDSVKEITLSVDGYGRLRTNASMLVLKGDKETMNTLTNPFAIVPVKSSVKVAKGQMKLVLDPLSVNVIRLKK
ncbi:alpha-L-arabinofuranosidase C-terminal domain-containing protein [Geofilum sp. OHC36d9]|uniref:alpha-L-arabinofuranosidase C-terminal domain-containing protein n=1 Tax=Geofilum sp. OHC36d9 TaxID=3458413 RepID=UPI004033CB1E